MKGLSKISLPTRTIVDIIAKSGKKHLIFLSVLTFVLLSSGYFIFNSYKTQLAVKGVAIVPTIKPSQTPIPSVAAMPTPIPTSISTPVPTLTNEQYLREVVTIHTCNGDPITITRSELPQYGHPYSYQPQQNFQNSPYCHQQSEAGNDTSNEGITLPQKEQMPNSYSCTTIGNTEHCSNGNTIIQNGNTTQIMGKQNGTCTTDGDYTHCSDGSYSYTHPFGTGTQSIGSGGVETCTQVGIMTECY